jgi:hypothetical protein
MRMLSATLLFLLAAGCYTARPIPISTQAENLHIDPASKLPLRVAIVVPDPHGHRIIMGARLHDGSSNVGDATNAFHGDAGMPVGREVAKVAGETFSQLFDQAIVMRQQPPPGEYDAIIQVDVTEVNVLTFYTHGGLAGRTEVALAWKLRVMDSQGVEILSRKDLTPVESYELPASFSFDPYINAMGAAISKVITRMVKEWGLMLSSSEELRAYSKRRTTGSERRP